tara:strand:+ start:1928 stop:2323 length:396 start_codon:yes stop_codon:yes gene_type:complete
MISSSSSSKMISQATLFYFSFATFIILFAGSVYDMQEGPTAMGNTASGKPIAILVHQVHKQYIIEGMAAAFMLFLASLGVIMFTSFGKSSTKKWVPEFQHYASLGFGVVLIVVGYNLLTIFLKIKVPLYLT